MAERTSTLGRARSDAAVFARALVGERLWPHQEAIAQSPARIRVVCSGRQAGKSRTLAIIALHDAFRAAGRRVLILSAGEDAAKALLAEISRLASAPLLAGSVVDDSASLVTLSNGSSIRSVPASEKQIRGQSIDLLILDEAAYISEDLWRAARYGVIARPGSRVVMASTPYGRRDRFFANHWRLGGGAVGRGPVEVGGISVESFHWPSTVSPMVDRQLVELWRGTDPERVFRQEVLAEWVDEAGAYFTSTELEVAIADYALVDPAAAGDLVVSAGVDWGQRDANALVCVARAVGVRRPDGVPPGGLWLPWLEAHHDMAYSAFIDRVVKVGSAPAGMRFSTVFSETNGVGAMPTEVLRRDLSEAGSPATVAGVHTDVRSKEDAFGALKLLMGRGELWLPRHPALLAQLAALEYETLDSGAVRIAVPDRAGHDDLAMALVLGLGKELGEAAAWRPSGQAWRYRIGGRGRPGSSVLVAGPGVDDRPDMQTRMLRKMAETGDPHAVELLREQSRLAWGGGRRGR